MGKTSRRMPLGRVVRKIPGNQDIIIKDYLTGAIQEHADAKEICHRAMTQRVLDKYRRIYENNEAMLAYV